MDKYKNQRYRLLQEDWSHYLWWLNWDKNGRMLPTASSRDPTQIVVKNQAGGTIAVLKGHTHGVNAAHWHPDKDVLLTAAWDGTVRLWSASGTEIIGKRLSQNQSIESSFWSPSGKRIGAITHDGYVHILDKDLGKTNSLSTGSSLFHGCFSKDESHLFFAAADGLICMSLKTENISLKPIEGGLVSVLPFKAGCIATTKKGDVILCEGDDYSTIYRWHAQGRGLSITGERIAAGFSDGNLAVFKQGLEPRATFMSNYEVTALTWHPNKRTLFFGTRGGPSGFINLP